MIQDITPRTPSLMAAFAGLSHATNKFYRHTNSNIEVRDLSEEFTVPVVRHIEGGLVITGAYYLAKELKKARYES